MSITLLLLFIYKNLILTEAFTKCCLNQNIVLNSTSCWDGSNITGLSCIEKVPFSSTDETLAIEIDEDDTLIITDINDVGSILVQPDKYCMTKLSENGTDTALVCSEEEVLPTSGGRITAYLQVICPVISVIFFFMTFIIYIFTPDLQDIEGKCIINFVAALLVGHIFISVMPFIVNINAAACDTAMFINFTAVLCCYTWLAAISFHVWRITIRPIFQTHMQWFTLYLCFGYGVPMLLVTTALVHHYNLDVNPLTAEIDCGLSGGMAVWIYFFLPIIVMLAVCIVLLIWTSKKLWIDIDKRDYSQSVIRLRKKCLNCTYLVFITGWVAILDMFYSVVDKYTEDFIGYLWDLSDCRNLLMGVAIFCVLVVMRNKVLKALGKRGLCCIKFPESWNKFVDEEREELENEEATLTQYSSGL